MQRRLAMLCLLGSALGVSPAGADEAPDVVVSLKPIHSLVAGVMQGVGEPHLLVKGAASAHTYSMRPSDARALADADLVFWVGEGMENFLAGPLASLGSGAEAVALSGAEGLTLHPYRQGGPWEAHADEAEHVHEGDGHDHEAEHGHDETAHADAASEDHDEAGHAHSEAVAGGGGQHDHAHAGHDMHLWLDPANAGAMVRDIAAHLAEADPAHAETYAANAASLATQLDALDARIAEKVAPVRGRPFFVFHDAYQYFEKRYRVAAAGSITVTPEMQPGADRLRQIRGRIVEAGATCVFAEPQFEPRLIETVVDGTQARTGSLDPHGADLEEGPALYFDLLDGLADNLTRCLADPA